MDLEGITLLVLSRVTVLIRAVNIDCFLCFLKYHNIIFDI